MRSATRLTISHHFQDAGNVSSACPPFGKQGYPSYTPRPKVKQTTSPTTRSYPGSKVVSEKSIHWNRTRRMNTLIEGIGR